MDLHYTKDDFILEWYSGTGKGGQHRNKHQNCCRITHKETGLVAVGTSSRSRVANQKEAFCTLANRIIRHFTPNNDVEIATNVIRTYTEARNEVVDSWAGKVGTYNDVVVKGNLGKVIEQRRVSTPNYV